MSLPLFDEKNKEMKVSYELRASVECFLSDQLGGKKNRKWCLDNHKFSVEDLAIWLESLQTCALWRNQQVECMSQLHIYHIVKM